MPMLKKSAVSQTDVKTKEIPRARLFLHHKFSHKFCQNCSRAHPSISISSGWRKLDLFIENALSFWKCIYVNNNDYDNSKRFHVADREDKND